MGPDRQVHAFGWASVFYIFGSLGVVWFALWLRKAASGPLSDDRVSEREREYIVANTCEQVRVYCQAELHECRVLGSRKLVETCVSNTRIDEDCVMKSMFLA